MIVSLRTLKLSALAGLLGNAFRKLRAICVDSRENLIFICFYSDGEISDDDKECCESTLDEIFAHCSYGPEIEFKTPIVRVDYPEKMPLTGEWVYYRYEDSPQHVDKRLSKLGTYMKISLGDLKLSAQHSLLGNIFPSLRAVCIDANDNLIQVYFYHENSISELEESLCKNTMNQMEAYFSHISSGITTVEVSLSIIRIDYPKKMPLMGDWVYYRQEDSSKYID